MMAVSDEQREFWNQKNPAEEYDTITFEHVDFKDPIRLVINQFEIKKFNGYKYIPVSGKISLPEQGSDLVPKLSLQFPRVVVGDEFKKAINSITIAGWRSPIYLIYEKYNELSMNAPTMRYVLTVSDDGVSFNRNTVQITATDDNPMTLGIPFGREGNPIYTIAEYPGLSQS